MKFFWRKKSLQEEFPQYSIGVGSYATNLKVLSWGESTTLRIGNYCSIAEGVVILLGGEHRSDWVTSFPFSVLWDEAKEYKGHPASKGDVIIGNDVWIATQCLITSGVTIGDGCVIGARSVVTKDIPPFAIAAGNPARVIRYRFDANTIEKLLNIQWWNWEREKIIEHMNLLLSSDIQTFIQKVNDFK